MAFPFSHDMYSVNKLFIISYSPTPYHLQAHMEYTMDLVYEYEDCKDSGAALAIMLHEHFLATCI